MIIDVHSHYFAREGVEFLRRRGAEFNTQVVALGEDRYEIFIRGKSNGSSTNDTYWSPSARIKDMDTQGIDVSLLSVVPNYLYYDADPHTCLEYCRLQNDAMAEVVKAYPDRFKGLAAAPLQDVGLAIKEIERAREKLGFVGVQIGTNVNGRDLDTQELYPFFKRAAEMGLFIIIHPCAVLGMERLNRYHLFNFISIPLETTIAAGSLIFGGVLARLPNLKICLVHCGGYIPWIVGRWDHGYEVRPEAKVNIKNKPSAYLRSFYYDLIIHNPEALRFALEKVGYDRFVLGTDYPFDMGDYRPVDEILAIEGVSEGQRQAILGGTVASLIEG